jgi:hypothetical protein
MAELSSAHNRQAGIGAQKVRVGGAERHKNAVLENKASAVAGEALLI